MSKHPILKPVMMSGSTCLTNLLQASNKSCSVSKESTCTPSIGRQLPSVKMLRMKGTSTCGSDLGCSEYSVSIGFVRSMK